MTISEFEENFSEVPVIEIRKDETGDLCSLIAHPKIKLRGTKADARRLIA